MARMVRGAALVVVALLGSGLVGTAIASPDSEGARLFEEGRTLAKQGKYEQACDAFKRSLALEPAMGTQLNYGDCHEHLGQLAEAWRLFDGVAEAEKITNPSRAKYARERADALLPRLGVIVLNIETPTASGLVVRVGDHDVQPAPTVHEIVDPGKVVITAKASAGKKFKKKTTVEAGQTLEVQIPAFPEPEEDQDQTTTGTTTRVRRRSRVYLAMGLGAAGVLSLASGVILGVSAKGDWQAQIDNGECQLVAGKPVCSRKGYDAQQSALTLATVGTVLGAGGIALVAAGAVVFLTAPRDLVVMPTVDSQSAGVAVVGNF